MPRPVILASSSPRRRMLLQELVPQFTIVVADIDESPQPAEGPMDLAERLAREKAMAVLARHPEALIIGGDTVVFLGDQVMGKPSDRDDAIWMLETLSGKTHCVCTGVCVATNDQIRSSRDVTTVTFRTISREEIEKYVDSGEPMDKAGAYAIQGGAAQFVQSVAGSSSNVVGLPVELLRKMLEEVGAIPIVQ